MNKNLVWKKKKKKKRKKKSLVWPSCVKLDKGSPL